MLSILKNKNCIYKIKFQEIVIIPCIGVLEELVPLLDTEKQETRLVKTMTNIIRTWIFTLHSSAARRKAKNHNTFVD